MVADGGAPAIVMGDFNVKPDAENRRFMPVDFKPLSYRGSPLVAGLPLSDYDLHSYGSDPKPVYAAYNQVAGDTIEDALGGEVAAGDGSENT